MKKSKKFIKFKDFIIKLPNSSGLGSSKAQNILGNNELASFVEPPRAEDGSASGADEQSEQVQLDHQCGYNPFYRFKHIHPNQQFGNKGYSIYVVDDEHEIHRFDIDTYEWSIISTTKDHE